MELFLAAEESEDGEGGTTRTVAGHASSSGATTPLVRYLMK
jgi:hypothetical protein